MIPCGGRGKDLEIMQRFLNKDLPDGFFNNGLPGFLTGSIRADVMEKENEYIVEAEIPGLKREQIEIQFENGCLIITARQSDRASEENGRYIRRERHYGELRRLFRLENVAEEKIKARYSEGVLRIILPKEEFREIHKKKIDIQ
jgi:HSP20 family protein